MFDRCGPFRQDFGQVLGQIILYFEKIVWVGMFYNCIPFGIFIEVSGQFKDWIILEMYEMVKVAHVVACAIVFILLCDQGWQEKC